jgi:hypothetical protein
MSAHSEVLSVYYQNVESQSSLLKIEIFGGIVLAGFLELRVADRILICTYLDELVINMGKLYGHSR